MTVFASNRPANLSFSVKQNLPENKKVSYDISSFIFNTAKKRDYLIAYELFIIFV